MTTIKTQLLCTLAARSGRPKSTKKAGILSAVALAQFINQTQKAAATEGTQQASASVKQASLDDPGNNKIPSDTDHSNHKDYAGFLKAINTNFRDEYDGTKDACAAVAKGNLEHNNTEGVVIKMAANLSEGVFKKPVFTGI